MAIKENEKIFDLYRDKARLNVLTGDTFFLNIFFNVFEVWDIYSCMKV